MAGMARRRDPELTPLVGDAPRSRKVARRPKSNRAPATAGLVKRLTEGEQRQELFLTPEQVAVLDKIASGKPPRNALAILKAIDLKLSYTQPKPKQAVEHSGPDGKPIPHSIEVVFVEPKPDGSTG